MSRRPVCLAALVVSLCAADLAAARQVSVHVTGVERLAWEQPAANAHELSGLRFIVYVDGMAAFEADAYCDVEVARPPFTCFATLPPLTPGEHLLQVAAQDSSYTESDRSSPLQVLMAGAAAVPDAQEVAWVSTDGIAFDARVIAGGIEDAIGLAILQDGRILAGEKSGRLHIIEASASDAGSVYVTRPLQDPAHLVAITATPTMDQGSMLHLVSRQESGLRLSTRRMFTSGPPGPELTLLDSLPTGAESRAALSVKDGLLFLALDDGGDPDRVGDAGDPAGKVLRMTDEGLTPPGSLSTHFSRGASQPIAMAWMGNEALLLLGRDSDSTLRLRVIGKQGGMTGEIALSNDLAAVDLLYYEGTGQTPLRREILVASVDGIARFRIRSDGQLERMPPIEHQFLTNIAAIAVDASGQLVVVAQGRLVRISAQR